MSTFISGRQPEVRIVPVTNLRHMSQRWFFIGCAVLGCLLWLVYIIRTKTPLFPYDDCYIAVHSAQNLWARQDPSFPGGHALDGATSIIHITFLATMLTFLSPLWALSTTLWLASIGYVLGLGRLAFAHGLNVLEAAAIVLVGVVAGMVPHHLQNGLETGLMLAGLTWALVFATDVRLRESRWAPLLWAQLPFLRPELTVVTILLLGLRIWRRMGKGNATRAVLAESVQDILIAVAGALPWLLFYYLNTGSPLPSTMSVKRNFFAEACWPASTKWAIVKTNILTFGSTLGIFTLALLMLALTGVGRVGLALAAALIGAYFWNLPQYLSNHDQRYLYVLIPFLIYGLILAIASPMRILRGAALVLLIACIGQSLWKLPERWRLHRAENRYTAEQLVSVAEWCNRNLPPTASLLIHDAGYISFATRFTLWDLVGLKSPALAAFHRVETFPTCGVGRADAVSRMAAIVHPDYFVVLRIGNIGYRFGQALRSSGWKLDLVRAGSNPGDPGMTYDVYKLTATPR
jgi:hypothetical protein